MNRKRIPEQLKNESRKLQRMANKLNLYICFCSIEHFDEERVWDELIEIRWQIDRIYIQLINCCPEYFSGEDTNKGQTP